MAQATALATTTPQTRTLQRFGSESDIKMLMVRQAAIFGIPDADIERPDVQASLVKATQYSITYGYLPGIHIHMLPFNKKVKQANGREEWIKSYEPALGEKAYKDSADRIAMMQQFQYLVETQEMTAAEVQAATAADPTAEYTEGDAGFKARVLRSDHANIYRTMGRQYDPEWTYGFWRKKAKKNYKGEWSSDETPAQRGPRDVAERRAYKAALMKVFTPVPVNDFEDARRFQNLSTYVETETAVDTRLMADNTPLHRDDDGMLWASDEPAEGSYRSVDEDTGEIAFMPEPIATQTAPATNGNGNGHKAAPPAEDAPAVEMISKAQLTALHAAGNDLYGAEWDAKRPELVSGATKKRAETAEVAPWTSASDLTRYEADTLIQGIRKRIVKAAAAVQTAPEENPFDPETQADPEMATA